MRLDGGDRRTLASGALVTGLILVLGKGLPAYESRLAERRAAMRELEVAVADAERVVRSATSISHEEVVELRVRYEDLAPFILGASTRAPSVLSGLVDGAIAQSGAHPLSVEVTTDSATHGFRRVRAEVSVALDPEELDALLTTLEAQAELLAVQRFAVTRTPHRREGMLTLTMTIEGLALDTTPLEMNGRSR